MKKRILLLSLVFLLVSSLTVFAQTANQQAGSSNSETTSGQQGSDSQRCSDVTRKVGQVTDRYDQSKEKYMNAYQNIYKNIEQVASKFKADGYDTTQLEQHLAEYNSMIQNANRYYNEFRTGMDNSKQGVCGNSESEAQRQFTSARTQLMNCKNEMVKLRTFAQETLRQDIMDLRAQVAE